MAMHHSQQDAVGAAARRRLDPRPAWHPILAARETEPGVWYLVDTLEKCYGIIRIIRRGGEVGYRAVTWAPEPADRQLIGCYRSLRGACEATHHRFLRAGQPGRHPNGLAG
ncbi:hypothetical protein ACX3O0_06980 [Homoserinimonas sp. A447]